MCCANRHIEMAKWLIEIKPTIDIRVEHEYAFRSCCRNGYIELSKWLFEMNPTIDISAIF